MLGDAMFVRVVVHGVADVSRFDMLMAMELDHVVCPRGDRDTRRIHAGLADRDMTSHDPHDAPRIGPGTVGAPVGRRDDRPASAGIAVAALWAAWLLSATALGINQIVFQGAGIGPGPLLGMISLAVQAGVCVAVGRGHRIARAMAVVFMLIAALPLQIVGRLIAERAIFSATYTVSVFSLKAIAVALLFTRASSRWFRGSWLR